MAIGKHYDLDTDNTLSNNSDNTIASQKATKEYIDNNYVPTSMLEEASTFAITGSYNDLINKPTIPTKTSELTNDSGFLTSHQSIKTLNTNNTTAQTASASEAIAGSGTISLHKVSKTGSYNDLLNKPTIPTVNNATLTLQQNGTTVSTFSANASSNVTANFITTSVKFRDWSD